MQVLLLYATSASLASSWYMNTNSSSDQTRLFLGLEADNDLQGSFPQVISVDYLWFDSWGLSLEGFESILALRWLNCVCWSKCEGLIC